MFATGRHSNVLMGVGLEATKPPTVPTAELFSTTAWLGVATPREAPNVRTVCCSLEQMSFDDCLFLI